MKIRVFAIGLLVFISFGAFSQQDIKNQFRDLIKNKKTLSEIVEAYNDYVVTLPEGIEKDKFEKHFARWAFYQSYHLDESNGFVDISARTLSEVEKLPVSTSRSANGNWSSVGPVDTDNVNPWAVYNGIGRVDRIVFHPTNPNIIYIGTPTGGLWKTTDGGSTWTSLSSFIPSLGISGIVVDRVNTNRIFVLTGDGDSDGGGFVEQSGYIRRSVGVLESVDGGANWKPTGTLSANPYTGFRLVQSPGSSNVLLAATSEGLYKTTDYGLNWVQVNPGLHYDIEFKPGNPNTIYATGVGEFYYSNDGGDTWFNDSGFDFNLCNGRVEIGVTPDNSSVVYLFAGPRTAANRFCGFFKSTNSGASFSRITNTPNLLGGEANDSDQSDYDLGIAVSPTDENKVFVAGIIVWGTTDSGQTPFTNVTTMAENAANPWYVHCDIHDIAINPLNGNLYAATDGGFYKSEDDGVSWIDLKEGIVVTQSYHMTATNGDANVVLIGNQDNGIKYRNNNTTYFSNVGAGDGFDVVINYADQNKGYAVINKNVYRYNNFLTTSPDMISVDQWYPQIEMHSSDTSVIFIAASTIWMFDINLNSSADISNGIAEGYWALKTCPSNANRIYAAGGNSAFDNAGNLYETPDGGTNWNTISNNPGFPDNFPRISDIGVRPNNSNYVFVSFVGYTDSVKVVYSNNAGVSWTNVSYNLPNVPVWSIEVDGSNNVYVGTDIGVFYKSNGSTTWQPYGNNLPNVPVSGLALNSTADQLLASTFGRGVWKSDLYSSCNSDITINQNISGKYYQSASNSITMTSQVHGGIGTEISLKSEGYIDLKPGFKVNSEPGNTFSGFIGDCTAPWPENNMLEGPPPEPAALQKYHMMMTQKKGTVEVKTGSNDVKNIVVRKFVSGEASLLLLDNKGNYLMKLFQQSGGEGVFNTVLDTAVLQPGLYFIYLVIDDEVTHIQELYVVHDTQISLKEMSPVD